MPYTFTCRCGRRLQVAEEHAGKQGRCPACGALLDVPPADPAELEGAPWAVLPPPSGDDEHAVAATRLPSREREEEVEAGVEQEEPVPRYRLYSPGHVLLATFLSNFVGGTILLALNYRAMGNRRAARVAAGVAVALMVLLLGALTFLPEKQPPGARLLVLLLILFGMYRVAKTLQGKAYEAHLRRGGRKASGWAAAGIGLLCAAVTLGALLGLSVAIDLGMGEAYEMIEVGRGNEVYYAGGKVSEAEARRLGTFLKQNDYFPPDGAAVVLKKSDAGFVLTCFVKEGAWNNPGDRAWFEEFGERASREVFAGKPVEVELCDENWIVKTRIKPAAAPGR
jgi:hypothetical protein